MNANWIVSHQFVMQLRNTALIALAVISAHARKASQTCLGSAKVSKQLSIDADVQILTYSIANLEENLSLYTTPFRLTLLGENQ